MTFDDIEKQLGKSVVDGVEGSVTRAFIAARQCESSVKGQLALEDLMLAMLASIIATPSQLDVARSRAELCAGRLVESVDAALRIYAADA